VKQQELRFWIETVLALFSALLFLVTLIWRDWIEAIFGVSPDAHNGVVEWVVVAAFAGVTWILAIRARLEWHGSIERRVSATPAED
jgi:hypothetical protein